MGNGKDNDFLQSNIENFVNHRTTTGDIPAEIAFEVWRSANDRQRLKEI